MSMKPQPIPPIPEETKRVAQAAFAKGNVYVQMRDALGAIYSDDLFTELYAQEGQPAFSPWRLALVTVMQFAENLSDRQAADAVRARLDWKYALSLELSDPGFTIQSSVSSAVVWSAAVAGCCYWIPCCNNCARKGY